MARTPLALAGAVIALLAPAAATAKPRAAHRALCASRARIKARHGVSGFHSSSCPTGRTLKGRRSHQLYFTAHGGVCPDAGLAPTAANIRIVRAATLCLVNRERAAHGEAPLHWNERLIRAAQNHTESMAWNDYFAHVGPGGTTPLSRMRHTGYIYSSRIGFEVGENIAWGSLWLGTPRAVVASWMASPGHRANILDPRYRDTGIGVSPHVAAFAHGQSGGIYTQDFGVRVSG